MAREGSGNGRSPAFSYFAKSRIAGNKGVNSAVASKRQSKNVRVRFLMRRAQRCCHSERSGAQSRNLSLLSLRIQQEKTSQPIRPIRPRSGKTLSLDDKGENGHAKALKEYWSQRGVDCNTSRRKQGPTE